MESIEVKSQRELDAIPVDYNGRIIIKFGTRYDRAVVRRRYSYPVVARENSSVVAWGNSSVEAWENSSVVAWGNSSVVAWENSSVVARENSSVVAWGNSSVEAWENSSVEAWGNTQVLDRSNRHRITTAGNARIVYDPKDIQSYADFYGLETDGEKIKLFKAVHKRDGLYVADWVSSFVYKIGETAVADSLDTDPREDCGHGIHMAYADWCLRYGNGWSDLAILELEVDIAGVIVPVSGAGKVRAASAKVLREVPLEELGLYGKRLAAERRKRDG